MGKNVIIVYEDSGRRALLPTIEKLKMEGFTVYEQSTDGWQTYKNIDNREEAKHIANSYKDKDLDFGIIVTHNGNPSMRIFQDTVRPKYGYYDIEHDIFSSVVEMSPNNIRIGTFSFTKLQTEILKRKNARIIEAKWYKFDECDFCNYYDNTSLNNAVVVDTFFAGEDNPFKYGYLFDKLYLKNYSKGFQHLHCSSNIETNLDEWWDTQSIVDMRNLGYFWFSQVSSIIVESLMMNRIPILWSCGNHFKNETVVDDIISHVYFKNARNDEFHKFNKGFNFITESNLEYKLRTLRADYKRRHDVIDKLKGQFVFGGKRNSVADELIKDMNRLLTESDKK